MFRQELTSKLHRRGNSNIQGIALVVVVAFTSLLISGCDPSFFYYPVDSSGHALVRLTETIDGVTLTAKNYEEKRGSRSLFYSINIENSSDRDAAVLGGKILVGGSEYDAEVTDSPEWRKMQTVEPGSSKEVLLLWKLDRSASKVLEEQITWCWQVRIGDEEHEFRIPMQREQR
ncbi:MAG: hypothetical protein KDA86_14190 [Planctomycetaceae bacterium]|nr:hypothetical protein [Planctomycetaceae bacterium]